MGRLILKCNVTTLKRKLQEALYDWIK